MSSAPRRRRVEYQVPPLVKLARDLSRKIARECTPPDELDVAALDRAEAKRERRRRRNRDAAG